MPAAEPSRVDPRDKLRKPPRIDPEDQSRWAALRVGPSHEFTVADQLSRYGYQPYCPVAQKWTMWAGGRHSKEKVIRQFAIFTGYVFCGLSPGQEAGRYMVPMVEEVLGDSGGPVYLPLTAILEINRRELAGEWDGTRTFRQKSPFQPGTAVSVIDGAFAGFLGRVDTLTSESRIWLLIRMFGRDARVSVETRHIGPLRI